MKCAKYSYQNALFLYISTWPSILSQLLFRGCFDSTLLYFLYKHVDIWMFQNLFCFSAYWIVRLIFDRWRDISKTCVEEAETGSTACFSSGWAQAWARALLHINMREENIDKQD